MRLFPALLLLSAGLLGCRREPSTTPTGTTAAALAHRTIPVRIVQMMGSCQRCNPALACGPEDQCPVNECAPDLLRPENVEARIAEANQVFARAGISFFLGSLEKYSMPAIVDLQRGGPIAWSQVRFQLRQALPYLPCNAFPPEMRLTPREWLIRASTLFSPVEAVPIWVTSVSMGGYGIYPWRARALLIDANQINRHRDTNFSHELGHFLGLPHSFGSPNLYRQGSYNLEAGTLRIPPRRAFVTFKEFWDLVYRPGPPHYFFLRRDDVRPEDEARLRPMQFWDLSPEQPSNCVLDRQTCRYACNVEGEWIQTGDPRLRALSFHERVASPTGAPVDHFGINIMDYNQSPSCLANGISESQIRQLRSVLDNDIPLDDQQTYPNVTGVRTKLGVPAGATPRARLDIDHNFQESPEPPPQIGMHPAWADDLLTPGEPVFHPALAAGPSP